MDQRKADLAVVRKLVNAQESEHYPASARTLLVEGLPFAVPARSASVAVHPFQTQFQGYLEHCLAEATKRAVSDGASAGVKIAETGAELASCRANAEKAKSELDEASAQVDAKKGHVAELEIAVGEAESHHQKCEKKGAKQQKEWADLRQKHESSKAIEEGALRMLEDEEGDEDTRSSAAAAVVNYIEEQNAEKVLQAAAPLALVVKPSQRGTFDRMTAEAVVKLVAKRVAELREELAIIEPEEKELRAEIAGLWAIADCACDAVQVAQEELIAADAVRKDRKTAHGEALERVKEQEAFLNDHEAAKDIAAAKGQELSAASAALERLQKPEAEKAEDEVGEPEAKRQRLEEAASPRAASPQVSSPQAAS